MQSDKDFIYLDNAAGAPPLPGAVDYFKSCALKYYPNQEAGHRAAYDIRAKLDESAKKLAFLLTEDSENTGVCWCGSGTEAVNIALGFPAFSKGNIVTSPGEHQAVLKALERLENTEVRCVDMLPGGRVDVNSFSNLLDEQTSLVVVHHVQSETGVIQDIDGLGRIIRAKAPSAKFMVDTIQSACKIDIPWKEAGIDIALLSGHKIGACSGAAVIFRKDSVNEDYFTGLRENEYLTGRADPPQVLTLLFCVEKLMENISGNYESTKELNEFLRGELAKINIEGCLPEFTVDVDKASPYILHFTVPGYQGQVLVRALSEKGFMISAGSACASETQTPSAMLTAMGMNKEKAFSALRISLWIDTSEEQLSQFINVFRETLEKY